MPGMVCWTPSQPLYTTAQYLATHAREQPRARAITDGTTDCSYRDLAINVIRIMDALTGIGIRPGQVVGVEMNDRFLHLVLLLACETLGATTISLLPFELGPDMDMGSVCDCILVTEPCGGANADKTFELTQEWLLQALLVPVGEHRLADLGRAPDPDSLVRLIKSSGTTGKPKVMGMTYRVQQRTLRNNLLYAADHIEPHPNYFCLYHFTIRGCHSRALLTLQLGGTIHFATFETAWNVLGARTVNFALFVTGDLERLVRNPPRNAVPFEIHVDVIGAALSPRLRRDTMQTLTTRILVTYGTNEVHHIAAVDADNVGTLFPGVEVTIVDDHGNKVPIGQTGLIRIRSDTMADGYVDAPALTKAAFIDGWYHTGDQGFQPSPGTLVVLGRTDDMLNVGGMKIPAGPVVAQIKAVDGIDDAMVARAVDGAGREVLLVAVEVGSNGGPPDLEGLISPIIQRYSSTYELLPLPAFPRTETGKIQRQAVQQAYRRTAGPNDG